MRINVGIPVQCLSDEHLRAEEHEIAMLPGFYNKVWSGKTPVPPQFTLGSGHISFFMNKRSWSLKRYQDLHQECIRRGINMKDKSSRWNDWIGPDIDYVEQGWEKYLVIQRIEERIRISNSYFHYNHTRIEKDDVIRRLKEIC